MTAETHLKKVELTSCRKPEPGTWEDQDWNDKLVSEFCEKVCLLLASFRLLGEQQAISKFVLMMPSVPGHLTVIHNETEGKMNPISSNTACLVLPNVKI